MLSPPLLLPLPPSPLTPSHPYSDQLSPVYHASAGAMAGIASSFVLCPLELVKCRLQALQVTTAATSVPKFVLLLSSVDSICAKILQYNL